MGLKVFFRGHKDIGGWVKPQKLRRPLLGQVVRDDKKGLLAKPQPLGFHSGGHHLERLSRAHFVCQQRITAVEDMGDSAKRSEERRVGKEWRPGAARDDARKTA